MRFLFCDSDLWKYIENCLALDFQFSSQIVDSNLGHPPFISSGLSRYVFIATSRRQFQLHAQSASLLLRLFLGGSLLLSGLFCLQILGGNFCRLRF